MKEDRRAQEIVNRVTAGVVGVLLSDPELREAIAAQEINRLIGRGELLPREALQIGSKYELLPVGRMAELEDACRAIVSTADADGAPDRLLVAIREMQGVLEGPSSLWEVDEEEPEPEPEPKKARRSKLKAVPTPVDEDPFEEEPPPDESTEDDPAAPRTCERCGVCPLGGVNDVDQALLSYTRWRQVLCEKCHQIGPAVEGSVQTEETDDGDG